MALAAPLDTLVLDTLIVFGYGPVEVQDKGGGLNVYARLNALAAGVLFASGRAKRLLITGGRTGGEALPSEAELMGRVLQRTFGVPAARTSLEPRARDTVENLVFSANLLDTQLSDAQLDKDVPQRLGFLALGLHIPRIEHLAQLVSLTGQFVALEQILAARSARHARFLEALKNSASYRALLTSQTRAVRGLRDLPDYWLPPLAELQDARLGAVRVRDDVRRFLSGRGLSWDTLPAFRRSLRALPRRFPEPRPGDEGG